MDINKKLETYKEDLTRVQGQRQELEQLEQRLTGAVLALQEMLQDPAGAVSGEVVDPAPEDNVE